MTTGTTPPQHMQALERANAIRLDRAALKRRIAAGEVALTEILAPDSEIPDCMRSAPIIEALTAQRRWGRARALRFLAPLLIGEHRRLDALTIRERRQIVARLDPDVREIPAAA